MSAFLGPVHVKMYDRILFQDRMSEAFLEKYEQEYHDGSIREDVEVLYPAAQQVALETIIDESNIHGWLSEAVENCEKRFSFIVTASMKAQPALLEEYKAIMAEFGKEYKSANPETPSEAFTVIHNILLDGMPCDFPFQVLEENETEVKWEVKKCPHSFYWGATKEDYYYQLRDAFVAGYLQGSNLSHVRDNGIHSIRKEA